ncbi:MAG: PAS domain S-box protein, partial [Gammaproteobacteria bacterium]|nr:PAS domain S-box protein [Gammaproteobacteria bacterium]
MVYLKTNTGSVLEIVYPLIEGMKAHVHIGMDEEGTHTRIAALRNGIIGLTLLLVVVVIAIAVLVSRRITRPLSDLADAMGDFGKHKEGGELMPSGGGREITHLTGIFNRMISTRERVDAAFREQEQLVRDLLNSTAEAIYGLDMQGNCTFANPACVQLLGYRDVDELIDHNMHDLIHHKRPDGTPYPVDECPIFRAFISGNGTHVDTEVLWRADGSSFPAEYWSYPIRRDEEVTGAVVTFLDITRRRQVEQELLGEKQLSEEYINSLPGLFYVFNEQRFVRWNGEWNRVTGYSDEELGDRCGTDFFDGEDRRLIGERMQKVFRDGAAVAEAELVTKDGRRIPYYFTGLRKKIDGREHLVGLGIDITERKQTEAVQARLHRALQQAQKMEAIGQLTGGIAHDFNNILGIILGNNELALNYCTPVGQTKLAKHLKRIEKAGERAKNLVAQMMAFSRNDTQIDKPLHLKPLV